MLKAIRNNLLEQQSTVTYDQRNSDRFISLETFIFLDKIQATFYWQLSITRRKKHETLNY